MARDYDKDIDNIQYGKSFAKDPKFSEILSDTSIDSKVTMTNVHKNINSMAGQLEKSQLDFHKQIKGISGSISSTVKQQERLVKQIQMRELASTRDVKVVEKSVQQIMGKLGYTIDILGKSSKKILVDTARTTKETLKQYGQALSADFNINKSNFLAMSLAKASPIFGYFVGKFMETGIFKHFSELIKEKLGMAVTFVGNKIKDLWGRGTTKVKTWYNKRKESKQNQKELPKLQTGGYVTKAGAAKLHAAEVVAPVEKLRDMFTEALQPVTDTVRKIYSFMKWSAVFKMAKNVYRFFRRGKYSSYLSKTKDAQVKLVEDFGTFFNQSMLRYDEMIAALKGKGKKDTDFETWQEEIAAAALKQQNNEKKFSMKEFFSEDNIKKFFSKETAKTFTDEFGKAFKAELKKPENMFNKVKEKIGDERIDSTKKTLGVISNWIKDVKNIAVEKKEERLDFGYGEEFSKTKRSKSERLKEKFGVYDAKERYKQAKNLFKDVKEIMKKEERLDFGYGSEFNSKKSSKYQKLKERIGDERIEKGKGAISDVKNWFSQVKDVMKTEERLDFGYGKEFDKSSTKGEKLKNLFGINKLKEKITPVKSWASDVKNIVTGEDRLDFGYGDNFGSKSKSARLKEKFGIKKAKEKAEEYQKRALNYFSKATKHIKVDEKSNSLKDKLLLKIRKATEGTENKLGLGQSALKKGLSSIGTWLLIGFGLLKTAFGKVLGIIKPIATAILKIPFKAIGLVFTGLWKVLGFLIKRFPLIAGALSFMTAAKDTFVGASKAREWHGVKEGEKVSTSQRVTSAIGGALGGTKSGLEGAKSGALKGAGMGMLVGSAIVPGLGTAIGGAIGAIAGGLLGAIGGKNISVGLQAIWDQVKSIIEGAWTLIKLPFRMMGALASRAKKWFDDKLSDLIWDSKTFWSEKIKSFSDYVNDKLAVFLEPIFQVIDPIVNFISDKMGWLATTVKSVVSWVTSPIAGLVDLIKGLGDKASNVVSSIKNTATMDIKERKAAISSLEETGMRWARGESDVQKKTKINREAGGDELDQKNRIKPPTIEEIIQSFLLSRKQDDISDSSNASSSIIPVAPPAGQKSISQKMISFVSNVGEKIASVFNGSGALPTDSSVVTSEFGPRNTGLVGASTFHKGIDLRAPMGSPIYAMQQGTVAGINDKWGKVILKHPNNYTSEYAHLSGYNVKPGDIVQKGQRIGSAGKTGPIPGMAPHLHHTIKAPDGTAINPRSFYEQIGINLQQKGGNQISNREVGGPNLNMKHVAKMQADKDMTTANLFNESTKGIQNSLQDSMNHSGKQTAVIINSMTNSISSSMNSLAKSVSGGGGGSNQGNDEISAILSGRMQ